ncbi:hypothetical protein D1AOALGA4SA_4467 [Olavius algarvensis Delta 1 endosymbiont]|nr:hypothetical protein D1AOALGA4SA_4467 [Olavius algarvensis Delta 1 endosymbiont]
MPDSCAASICGNRLIGSSGRTNPAVWHHSNTRVRPPSPALGFDIPTFQQAAVPRVHLPFSLFQIQACVFHPIYGRVIKVDLIRAAASGQRTAGLIVKETLKKRISNIEQGIMNVEVRYSID